MKKSILIILIISSCFSVVRAQQIVTLRMDGGNVTINDGAKEIPQIPIGKANTEFFYDYRCVTDTTDRENREKDITDVLVLQLGDNISKFFSYRKLQADSLMRSATGEEIMANPSNFVARGAQSYTIYKNYPTGKLTFTDKISRDNMKYEEMIPQMEWELLDESREIKGYICYRAECDFRGRRWIAWYTPEIAIMDGPWKFGGLPGMIFEVSDSKDHYSFILNGIRTALSDQITMSDLQYHNTTREKYQKTLRQFQEDPVGYLSANSGVKVSIRNQDGTPRDPSQEARNLNYNSIEIDIK